MIHFSATSRTSIHILIVVYTTTTFIQMYQKNQFWNKRKERSAIKVGENIKTFWKWCTNGYMRPYYNFEGMYLWTILRKIRKN